MKYVIDKDGKVELGPKGGIMIDPETGSQPYEFDVFNVTTEMSNLRGEARKYRTEKAELKAIVDSIPESVRANPKAAGEALITVSSLDEKHKVDIEKVRKEMETAFQPIINTKEETIKKLSDDLFSEKVTSKFATSKALEGTIFDKTREVATSHFKNHFTIDEKGQMIGKFKDGSTIYSKTNPGKLADFDECISSILDVDPNKQSYLAPTGQRGPGPGMGNNRQTGEGQQTGALNKIKAGIEARKQANQ